MNILYVGDIVGSPGRRAFSQVTGRLRAAKQIDFVVVNAENSAAGRGITPDICDELFAAGANIITLGDHVWDQKEIIPHLAIESRIARPANYPPDCPGRGVVTVDTPVGKLSVIVLIGRVFLPPADCPFRTVDAILKRGDLGSIVLVEIHAEATSEKIAMGRYLDGRVASVVGTHTHVQTSDDAVLPRGTAYLTDLGMTGPKDGVIGMDVKTVIPRFLSGMPTKFEVGSKDVSLEGAIITVDPKTGRAKKIKRVREHVE